MSLNNSRLSLDFPGGSNSKESAHNSGDLGSIAGLGRSPGEGKSHNNLWKTLKEMGKPDPLTCLLRSLRAGQEAKLELDMEQQTSSKSGQEYVKAVYCHSAYLTYMQSTS